MFCLASNFISTDIVWEFNAWVEWAKEWHFFSVSYVENDLNNSVEIW